MTLQQLSTLRILAAILLASALLPSWASSERLAAIPIPAALHPHLKGACQAWGRHIQELIEQHRSVGELSKQEIDLATDRFYTAQGFCSMNKLLEALAMYESISLGRPKYRPLW